MATSSSAKLTALWLLLGATMVPGACSSSNTSSGGTSDTPISGVALGPLDNHCTAADGGLTIQPVGVCGVIDQSAVPSDPSICLPITFGPQKVDAGMSAVDTGADGAAPPEFGATMYGAAGYDDDCKYYVSWVSTPIQENVDTYFTVSALRLADMQPARCASIRPDTVLNVSHGVPGPRGPAPEIAPGVYKVGPIRFDAKGIWTERFHLFEECDDAETDSPHGHAAFYINVP